MFVQGVVLLPATVLAIPLLRLSGAAAAVLLLMNAASLALAAVLLSRHRLAMRSRLEPPGGGTLARAGSAVPAAPTLSLPPRSGDNPKESSDGNAIA